MTSPNLSEVITTTLRNRSGVTANNVLDNNALFNRLRKRGNVKTVDGGRTIVQEMTYAENGGYIRYQGVELLPTSPSDVISAAEFDWKQAAVPVVISGLEELQNSGEEKIIDLLDARISNAEDTLSNNLASDAYSNGTASSGKQIGGLQLLVADDPTTGTVGTINRANWEFWRNVKFQTSSDGGSAASASNITGYMNALYNQLVRGTDKPDLITADTNYYGFYENSLQGIQRITNPQMADAGFVSLKYKGADVVLDGGIGGACPTNHMYMLNTKYLFLRPHKDRNMVPLAPRNSVNQDASVQYIAFAGNMTTSGAKFQGVMFQT
jgi:hypothetical protein